MFWTWSWLQKAVHSSFTVSSMMINNEHLIITGWSSRLSIWVWWASELFFQVYPWGLHQFLQGSHFESINIYLSFATQAAIDVLPTGDNLNTWGNTDAINCELCGNRSTLLHIVNGCKTALDQGRYTFRHNTIVSYLVKYLKENVNQDTKVFPDIKGSTTTGTIPADIVPTAEKPDIVFLWITQRSLFRFSNSVFPLSLTSMVQGSIKPTNMAALLQI